VQQRAIALHQAARQRSDAMPWRRAWQLSSCSSLILTNLKMKIRKRGERGGARVQSVER